MDPVMMKETERLFALALISDVLDGCNLVVFNDPVPVTRDSVKADFTLVTQPGMASRLVTAFTAYYGPDDIIRIESEVEYFITTANPSPAFIVYGWLLLDATSTNIIAGKLLDVPVPINNAMDGLAVRFEYVPFPG